MEKRSSNCRVAFFRRHLRRFGHRGGGWRRPVSFRPGGSWQSGRWCRCRRSPGRSQREHRGVREPLLKWRARGAVDLQKLVEPRQAVPTGRGNLKRAVDHQVGAAQRGADAATHAVVAGDRRREPAAGATMPRISRPSPSTTEPVRITPVPSSTSGCAGASCCSSTSMPSHAAGADTVSSKGEAASVSAPGASAGPEAVVAETVVADGALRLPAVCPQPAQTTVSATATAVTRRARCRRMVRPFTTIVPLYERSW